MMTPRIGITAAFLLSLLACSEKPQTAGAAKLDASPYSGAGMAYTEKNWKAGDKTSWESALRARAQHGQNDYSRAK